MSSEIKTCNFSCASCAVGNCSNHLKAYPKECLTTTGDTDLVEKALHHYVICEFPVCFTPSPQ